MSSATPTKRRTRWQLIPATFLALMGVLLLCGMTLKVGVVSYYNVKYGWIEFRPGNDSLNELVVTPRRVIGHLLYVVLGIASLFAARDCMRKRLVVGIIYAVAVLLGVGIANVIAIPEIMFGRSR